MTSRTRKLTVGGLAVSAFVVVAILVIGGEQPKSSPITLQFVGYRFGNSPVVRITNCTKFHVVYQMPHVVFSEKPYWSANIQMSNQIAPHIGQELVLIPQAKIAKGRCWRAQSRLRQGIEPLLQKIGIHSPQWELRLDVPPPPKPSP
jgi:hypothetical protein